MLKQSVKEVMASVFEIDVNSIGDDASQKTVSKWDSLDHLNLIVELEEKFDLSFEPEDIGNMVSLEAIVTVIEKLQNA